MTASTHGTARRPPDSTGDDRFRTLFDRLPHVAIQGYAPDGTTLYWNPASEALYGYSQQEALGANLLDLIVPQEMKANVRATIAQMADSGQAIAPSELTLQRKDGSRVQVLSSHALVRTPDGRIELFCVDIDLSARKQAEDALRESEQRFSSIANATPVMIWLAGQDTLCYWFNAGWLAFTGRTLEQEAGNGWAQGVHPDDFQRCVDFYQSHFRRQLPFQMEYRLKHHSGNYRWIHDSGVPRFDADGVFLGYIGSCVDAHEVHTIKNQLAAMADAVPGVVYQYASQPDGSGKFVYVSHGLKALFGVSAEAAMHDPLNLEQYIDPRDLAGYRLARMRSTQELSNWEHEFRIITADGQCKWVRGASTPHAQPDANVLWSGILTDITQTKALEARLRQSANVFAYVQEAIIITDARRVIVDVNAAFTRTTGYSRDEVMGRTPGFLKSGHQSADFYAAMWAEIDDRGFWIGKVFNRNKSGQVYAVMLNISSVTDDRGEVTHYVGVATDINQIKAQQELLERVAHFDALTGLPNRVLLADRLQHALAQARRSQTLVAVCYLDLDGFKHVNDTLGHDAGDLVLQTVARRMNDELRASDTAARIGGDEFVVLLSNLESPQGLRPMLDRLLHTLAQPIDFQGRPARVSASIGVALYPDNARVPDTLLRQADMAMYEAKASGKNCYLLSTLQAP